METVRSDHIAGMPQLAYTGLSENWLLKTCGDLHWRQLAAGCGLAVPDFRDGEGNPVYAAFTAVRVRDAALERIGEHGTFTLDSAGLPAGGVKRLSQHAVASLDGTRCATVTMLSTFIRRTRERDNRSVVRAMPSVATGWNNAATTSEAAALSQLARRFRSGDWGTHLGLRQQQDGVNHVVDFLPCPYNDFNGADLMYFASFQAMVDRAEWQWRSHAEPPTLAARDLFFHGNVNVGEALELTFAALREDESGLAHWCEVRRAADGEKIADIVTRKRWRQR
ncbi:Pnap_2097 family protein [Cupriavidus oxalaticus]|uniref:Biosynthetic protein, Pnap_2097 family n=1 Tax=Cupriavidus oxalaticus TaxID=96344 RepID=A0A4P7LI40_9BURK|nr:Pnap_2097 family protein [Cupriavidus oxalaticus]QBY55810.1 hypothetical protein E0W60_33165 [Cupriavidus oxalaticus]